MIFNIVVDAVVQAVLEVVCSSHESQHGMGYAAGERKLFFYADGGRIVGREHGWVHDALAVTVAMLCRIGLEANLEKTKAMVCTPKFIWEKWGETAYKQRATGEGETFRERKKTRMNFTKYGVTVVASYLKTHMAQIHVICTPPDKGGR